MQVLFDLLHSLSKDEKRLYHQHRRDGRFQKIYEAYLASAAFHKNLDRDLYEKEFTDVSKPYFSMQKRSLMDDVVTVLLSYSNLQIPQYKLPRNLAKAQILLERGSPAAAVYYLEEAAQLVTEDLQPNVALSLVNAQKRAEELLGTANFSKYVKLVRDEKRLLWDLFHRPDLNAIRQALQLLKRNSEQFTEDVVAQHAEELIGMARNLTDTAKAKANLLDALEVELQYHDLVGRGEDFHRELVHRYKQVEANQPTDGHTEEYYRVLNLTLQNALRVGDFLLMSGLIYKTGKVLEYEPEKFPASCLPDYLEVSALYHFYENELSLALREMEDLLRLPKVQQAQLARCTYYYLSFLVAAHLPIQAKENLERHARKYPFITEYPAFDVFRMVVSVDMHESADELSLTIEGLKPDLRRDSITRPQLDALQLIQAYLERKALRTKPLHLFPAEWEQAMRVDLWLEAKVNNSFYYNAMLELWQERRKVFS
jgi:hypothetical protein